jgi:hypothetical protein
MRCSAWSPSWASRRHASWPVVQASRALLEGRFADAEALVESALRSGGGSMPWDAVIFSRVQRFALRLEDGRLAEPEPTIRRSAAEFPTRPLFGCLLARLLTELGDQDQARSVFEQLAAGRFAGIRVNNDLLLSLSHLAEVAWFLRDVGRAPCTACCFPTAAWSWTPGNRAPAPWTATWAWRR